MKNKSKKICRKVFTKEKSRGTIKEDYNPLKVNYEIYRRGSGLNMKSKNEKGKFIELLFKICLDLGVENSEKEVEDFLTKNKIAR